MQKRNHNIEILRIISMVMIVYHHFYVHSQFVGIDPLSKKYYLIQSLGNFGKVGVLIFGLISGYFLVNQTFSLRRIFQISNIVRFYTLFSFVVWLLLMRPTEGIKANLLSSLFPILFDRYWFVTAYLMLLLFQPILKPYLKTTPRKSQLGYFLLFLFAFSLIEWIGIFSNTFGYFEPSEGLSFIIIALGGNLVRLYQEELHGKWFSTSVCVFFLSFLFILAKPFLVYQYSMIFAFPTYFLTGMGSINAILFSIALFVIVTKLDLRSFTSFSKISPVMFDVYLIHDNSFFRPLIWTVIFKNAAYFEQKWFPLVMLLEPLLVFGVSLSIGFIRIYLFKSFKRWRRLSFHKEVGSS